MIMIWDLFSSAFRRDLDADKAFPMSPKEQSAAEAPVASPDTDLSAFNQDAIFIARQSIFDATEKVWAYQLLVRPTGILPEAAPATSEQSARLIVDTLNTFGAHTVLGNRLGLISLPGDALLSDIVELLPCSNFILEFPAELLQSPAAEARCAQLLAKGYQLALACTHNDVDSSQIPRTANYVTYDLALQNLTTIASLDRGVKPYNLTRLVRNVNTRADFKACKAIGFDLYQGNFFAKAETVASNRVDPARDRIMEIFNLVMNKADITQIEDAFKHDVALCYSLLCYINSVGIGMQYKVSSIRNAIMLLGYDFLWRWLSLLVYTGIDLSANRDIGMARPAI